MWWMIAWFVLGFVSAMVAMSLLLGKSFSGPRF